MNLRLYELLRTLINIALSIMTFFLVTRFVLRFFSTNPQTPFVAWILSVSNVLISPFVNIVPDINTATGVLDIVSLVTLLAYLIIGYIVLSVIEGLSKPELVEEDERVVHYHDIPYRRKYRYPQRKEDFDL